MALPMKDDVRYQPVPGTPGLVLGVARLVDFEFDRHSTSITTSAW